MKTRQLVLCALFAALTGIGAFAPRIPIPGTPLVITMQTFVVFLCGLMLTPRYALTSQLVYAAIGILGLPIFSTGGGLGYVLSPTFGFIIGFAVCSLMVSLLVRKTLLSYINKNADQRRGFIIFKIVLYALMSIVAMYICGVAYMYIIFNFYLGQTVTLAYVIVNAAGIFFFIDIIKFALAVPLGIAVLRRIPSIRQN